MQSCTLLVVSLVFACIGLSDPKSLKKRVEEARMGADPERPGSRDRGAPGRRHRHAGSRPQRAAGPLLSWMYPEEPAAPVAPVAPVTPPVFQLRPQTTRTANLAVRCGGGSVGVEVSQDLQGSGRLVQPEELTLGGCAATLADDSSQVLVFHSPLHGCNSELTMTNETLIYAFQLLYQPEHRRDVPIVRTEAVVIGVECHYPRLKVAGFN